MKFYFFLFCFLLLSSIFVLAADDYKPYLHKPEVPESPKLELSGTYKTDLFTGAGTYTYPIKIPPGRSGLTPELVLSYNSHVIRGNPEVLGIGWSLSQSYIKRNTNFTLTDTSDDAFTLLLEGQSYDLAYSSLDGRYHTLAETYMRIQNFSSGSNEYWLLTLQDGKQYRFGFTSDSELSSNTGKGYNLRWYLDQIQDTHGNTINYNYQNNIFSGDNSTTYLSTIVYNSDGYKQINFSYEAYAPGARRVFEEGNEVNRTGRLRAISIFVNNNFTRVYRLQYTSLSTENHLFALSNISSIGKDNVTVLHRLYYSYNVPVSNYSRDNTSWYPPELFSNTTANDEGVRLVDLNNDGFVDYVRSRGLTGDKRVWLNNRSSGWGTNQTSFEMPRFLSNNGGFEYGLRFTYLNDDSFIDLLFGTEADGGLRQAWLNNGTAFVENSSWIIPAEMRFQTNVYGDLGVLVVDLNGDNRDDLLRGYMNVSGAISRYAYLNNGSGWENATSTFAPPIYFIENDSNPDLGVRMADLNGDSYPDLIQAFQENATTINRTWLNTGNGWLAANETWMPPVFFVSNGTDTGVRFVDVNLDGLPDLWQDTNVTDKAWINTGHGWANADTWDAPDEFIDSRGNNIGRRVADVNGDSFADLVIAYVDGSLQYQYSWLRNGTAQYVLSNITHEFGGVTQLYYNESTDYNMSGNDSRYDLGFNLLVLSAVQQNNSLANGFNILSLTNYSYSGGVYDAEKKEFLGFAVVNETLPDGTLVDHFYHQDLPRKGMEYKTETYNSSRVLFLKEEKSYRVVSNGSFSYVYLDNVSLLQYDGLSLPKAVNYTFTYDGFGNILSTNYSGGTKRETWEYYVNSSSWIVNKIKRYNLFDGSDEIRLFLYSYDGKQNQGPQEKGELSRVDKWLSTAGSGTQTTSYTYDSYGNILSVTDSLGRVSSYSYGVHDPTFTYPDVEINAMGHRTDMDYDLATGNMLWREKNGIREYMYYDNFSRIWKEVEAGDSYYSPTRIYNYTLDGIAPERISVLQKETENDTYKTFYFYDGFGNLVQVQGDADGNQSVVTDFLYDNRSRVRAVSIPHFANTTRNLSFDSSYYTNYTYDPLSRVIRVTSPDLSNISISFTHFNVTVRDANNHKKVYVLDSYDRIMNVYEYNNDPLVYNNTEEMYNTSYSYDAADALLRIIDTQGNQFIYQYDSLGRRNFVGDPDLGNWSYSYDSLGNVIQTDGEGYLTNISYDALNRVIQKKTNTTEVNFSYDGQYQGTLTNVSFGTHQIQLSYDERYKVLHEEQIIFGKRFTVDSDYDSMERMIAQRFMNDTGLGYLYNEQNLIVQIPNWVNTTAYNAFGNPLNRTLANGQITSYAYNATNGRLLQIRTGNVQQLDYQYDAVGNIKEINDTVNNQRTSMSYDYLDRLTNVTIGARNFMYVYDETGRILMIVRDYNETTRMIYEGRQAHAPSAVISSTVGVMAYKQREIASNGKNRTFEFYLVNVRNVSTNNASWIVGYGDGSTSSGLVNLSAGQVQRYELSHVYANANDYAFNVTVSYANMTDASTSAALSFGIKPHVLVLANQSLNSTGFNFSVKNTLNAAVQDVNWSCSTGQSGRVNLSAYEEQLVSFTLNHSLAGWKNMTCSANSTEGSGNVLLSYLVHDVEITEMNISSISGDQKTVRFSIKNYFSTQNVNWSVESAERQHTGSATINGGNSTQITQQVNYSTPGLKRFFVNVSSLQGYDNRTEYLRLQGLELERYYQNNVTYADRHLVYELKNNWASNLTVNWNLTDPVLNNSRNITLSYNETLLVFIDANYTSPGVKNPQFTLYNSSMNVSVADRFALDFVEIPQHTTLSASSTQGQAEFFVRNNVQRQNISWSFNTGVTNISSTRTIDLNNSEFVMIFVAANYSYEGAFITEAYANSTQWNDSLRGAMVL